jgi:formate-dependent nitrite reductase cytochrome c552 subunit
MTFVREAVSKTHLAAGVGCTKCHGLSDKHANDENIGATKPDIVYPRDQVDGACGKCHQGHDAPAAKVVARFVERKLPADPAPVCTDCHGAHRIDRAAKTDEQAASGTEVRP